MAIGTDEGSRELKSSVCSSFEITMKITFGIF